MVKQITDNVINSILIMIPVFNDWESLEILLMHLDEVLQDEDVRAEVVVVDDASSISAHDSFLNLNFKAIKKVYILELRRNLGHQRAIAIGLAYIEANIACKAVVVMDGDGEDAPRDVLKLIHECDKEGYEKIVFARRTHRSESKVFKLFYIIYKGLYKLLTGQKIRIGNFSIIPRKILRRLVVVSEIWNHYAAGVLKARVPYTEVSTRRSTRLSGQSKMNFVLLVIHGLSAISVYGDTVGVRLLVASCLLILFTIISIIAVIVIKLTTTLAIPGWTSYIVTLFFIILMQAVMISLFFIFVVLGGRNNPSFLPQRDYHYFVSGIQTIFPRL
jgi:glycosyltransferase involved in cell wall biosynthesis